MGTQIALDPATVQRMQQENAKKIFTTQVAMGVIGNEELMKLAAVHDAAAAGAEISAGAQKAADLRDRAIDVVTNFLDESGEE